MRWLIAAAVVVLAAAGAWWLVTAPQGLAEGATGGIEPDPARGEVVFHAAGCASCHLPEGWEGDGAPVLSGGQRFETEFGTFVAPNISPHPEAGIGGWSDAEIVAAMANGVSPDGRHYFPAFPYTAYGRAEIADLVHLTAYLRTLPESDRASEPHELAFPYSIRRNVGIWKRLFVTDEWVLADAPERGRYLVEALGHCAECHTPRGVLGGLDRDRWMAGAPNPSGDGSIPNITPAELSWSEDELVAYFTSGFTPSFDTAGGSMAAVVRELGKLPEADRRAIAAYVKALPAVESAGGNSSGEGADDG